MPRRHRDDSPCWGQSFPALPCPAPAPKSPVIAGSWHKTSLDLRWTQTPSPALVPAMGGRPTDRLGQEVCVQSATCCSNRQQRAATGSNTEQHRAGNIGMPALAEGRQRRASNGAPTQPALLPGAGVAQPRAKRPAQVEARQRSRPVLRQARLSFQRRLGARSASGAFPGLPAGHFGVPPAQGKGLACDTAGAEDLA